MAVCPFKYMVEFVDEFNDYNITKVKGITFGENFHEAMENIEDYYGKELEKVYIEGYEEAPVYEFNSTEG